VRLRFKAREFVLGDGKESLTMGRAEENDIILHGSLISRIHARIEIARNKVLLVDQSTNGTFVVTHDGKESFIRRDTLALAGQGMIGLGKLPDSSAPDAIRYQIED
jgi:pSer/pThr/pTyr-binding forkhead associated (FHA) protein